MQIIAEDCKNEESLPKEDEVQPEPPIETSSVKSENDYNFLDIDVPTAVILVEHVK